MSHVSDSYEEEQDQHDLDNYLVPYENLDLDLAPIPNMWSKHKWSQNLIKAAGDVVGDPNDRRRTSCQYQNEYVALSRTDLILPERCFMMMGSYPQTFKEACHDPRWQVAMDEEFDLLHDNKTWKLVSLP